MPEAANQHRPARPAPPGDKADDGANDSTDADEDHDGPPTLAGGSTSDTPRLDALLGDQR